MLVCLSSAFVSLLLSIMSDGIELNVEISWAMCWLAAE